MTLTIETGRLAGLRTVVLENDLLRVMVLPEAGARIWQITYKPLNADLLWNNPNLQPAPHPLGTAYDDNWSGGWDDLFPNDEAGSLAGLEVPDHGELWTGDWSAAPHQTAEAVGLDLSYRTPITHFLAERSLRVSEHSPVLEVNYRLTNQSSQTLPFLWKLHPAFAVSPHHRIDFPRMIAIREPEFPGTLESAPSTFDWPCVQTNSGRIDSAMYRTYLRRRSTSSMALDIPRAGVELPTGNPGSLLPCASTQRSSRAAGSSQPTAVGTTSTLRCSNRPPVTRFEFNR